MCGIFGLISSKFSLKETEINYIYNCLKNRGPNNSQMFKIEEFLTFLHTRLAIQDLSKNANQPMLSLNKRFLICFNGEIYNHKELRSNFFDENKIFKTHSDTETLVEMFSTHGVENTLKEIKGMFAIALWDLKKNKLFLAVDRFSEKPLYYYKGVDYFVFTSDLSAFKKLPFVKKKVSKIAVSNLLKFNYVSHPYTIYENIYKLSPGTVLDINFDKKLNIVTNISKKKYWDINKVFTKQKKLFEDNEIFNEFEKKLETSIKSQLISDIPIGSFLSGGLDSSLITILMSKISGKKINTFSIGFEDKMYDETKYSDYVSSLIRSNHYKKIFSKNELIEIIPKFSDIYSEPFGDSSGLPTSLVAHEAKKNGVNVVLTGDGCDEFWGGYNRYIWTEKFFKFKVNKFISKNLIKFFEKVNHKSFNNLISKLNPILPAVLKTTNLHAKIIKVLKMSSREKIEESYQDIICNSGFEKILNFSSHPIMDKENYLFEDKLFKDLDVKEKMMIFDINHYLPGDILTKVDRASMYHSVETRAPFLDKDLVEFSSSISQKQKFKNNSGKIIIKKILMKYCDPKFIHRPKMGFGIPLGNFLKKS